MPRAISHIDAEAVADVDVRATYRRLLGYTRPFLGYFLISIIGFALFAASQPAFAMLMEVFLRALNGEYVDGVWFIPALCVGIALLRGVGGYLGNYYMGKAGAGIVHNIRCDLFGSLIYLPMQFYDTHKTGNLVSLFTYNATALTQSVTRAITIFVREGLTIIALFAYMIYSNWQLTMIFLLLGPPLALVIAWIGKRIKKLGKGIQASMADINHVSNELLGSVRMVKSAAGEQRAIEQFSEASQNTRRVLQKMTKTTSIYTPVMQMLVVMAMAVVMYVVLQVKDTMEIEKLIAYVTAAALLPKPVRSLSGIYAQILQGVVAAEEIFSYVDREREKDDGQIDADRLRGKVRFDRVSFTYAPNDEHVLNDISFVIEPCKTVALVGKSGSGKSTVASLLSRFYTPTSGRIAIDDIAIDDYRLSSLREHIAIVSQHVSLFNDTVRANILYGCERCTEDQMIDAAKAANAHDFICSLANGYDTVVGEDGSMLSGGQRQRIAIARALLRDAPILILDEATSALDNESEALIQSALEDIMRGRTTLVIAHRLSTVQDADEILVLGEGRILERGGHDALIALGGEYAKMVQRDFS